MVHEWESCSVCIQTMSCNILGLLVAYWLKHWTTDRKIQGSSPTSSRDLFLFWVHSALPQKSSRRFSFASFGGDVKQSVLGNPLKISLSAIGDFLINWVIPGKTIKKNIYIYISRVHKNV